MDESAHLDANLGYYARAESPLVSGNIVSSRNRSQWSSGTLSPSRRPREACPSGSVLLCCLLHESVGLRRLSSQLHFLNLQALVTEISFPGRKHSQLPH